MKVLVTGASGFIGSNFVQFLFNRKIPVTALVRQPLSPLLLSRLPKISFIQIPVFTEAAIDQALSAQKFDAIVHLAAAGVHPADRDGAMLICMNSLVPGMLVAAASRHGVKNVIIAGSSAEYQEAAPGQLLKESSPLEYTKLYGASKAAGSQLALAQGLACKINVIIIRLFNAFGPGEAPHRLLPSLLRALEAGESIKLSAGTQVRDFVFIEDVCTGLWAALTALVERRMPPGVYNLATGIGHSVIEFGGLTSRLWGGGQSLLQWGQHPFRPDDLPFVVGDASLLRHTSGWKPQFTLEQGIAASIENFRNVKNYE